MEFRTLILAACTIFLSSCVVVGTGDRTLVLPCETDENIRSVFPEFTRGCAPSEYTVAQLTAKSDAKLSDFENYIGSRYGDLDYNSLAELNSTVRLKESIPLFLTDEANALIQSSIKEVELNKDLRQEQKDSIIASLRAKLLNTGRMPVYTTTVRQHEGADVYHYFPRVEIDFSAKLRSTNEQDSFKRLGIVVKLRQSCSPGDKDCTEVKFVDYSPKEASIVEFSRGQLGQSSSASLTPSLLDVVGDSISDTAVDAAAPGASLVTGDSASFTRGLSANITYGEAFTNQLVDALEQKTTGIIDNGKSFFASYRSTKNKRISGTYTYDLMLEVPTKAEIFYSDASSDFKKDCADAPVDYSRKPVTPSYLVSVPCTDQILADIYLVSVVRHVYDRGFTGVFTRVPEVENDDVFEQVIIEKIENVALWSDQKFVHWASPFVAEPPEKKKLTIYANHDSAQFAIVEAGKVVGVGTGRKFEFSFIDSNPKKPRSFDLVPSEVLIHGQGGSIVYEADQHNGVKAGQHIVIQYSPKN